MDINTCYETICRFTEDVIIVRTTEISTQMVEMVDVTPVNLCYYTRQRKGNRVNSLVFQTDVTVLITVRMHAVESRGVYYRNCGSADLVVMWKRTGLGLGLC